MSLTVCILDRRHGATRPEEDFCEECCALLEVPPKGMLASDQTGSSPQGTQEKEMNFMEPYSLVYKLPLVEGRAFDLTPNRTIATTRRKALKTDLCVCHHRRSAHNKKTGFCHRGLPTWMHWPCACPKFRKKRRKPCPNPNRFANAAIRTTPTV